MSKIKFIILNSMILLAGSSASAQGGYEEILRRIEANSTTLSALRERMEAEKLANHTGLTPANPEVEVGYLWGTPSAIGNRTDIGVRQTFDFPTAYAHRGRIADLRDRGAELAYRSERIELLLSAKKVLIELTCYNALAQEYETRLRNAERMAQTYAARLERGEGNAIENNKAQLNLQTVRSELSRIEIEREALLSELARMNGGEPVEFTSVSYPACALPADFAAWQAAAEQESPVLQYLSTQVDIAGRQVRLDRSMAMPKISLGYMSERVVGQRFQGITAGLSIPLWENRNRTKQAKSAARAAETMARDTRVQFHGRLENLYARAAGLHRDAVSYRAALARYSNAALLDKALAAGEISLLEYLLETEYYYAAIDKLLEAERDYQLAVAELSAVEL